MPIRNRLLRRLLWAFAILAATSVAISVGLWLGRDLPRSWLEQTVARSTGAETRLGRLALLSRDSARLEEILVGRLEEFPWIDEVYVERLDVVGSPLRVRRGELGTVRVTGCRIRFNAEEPIVIPSTESAWKIGRIEFERCLLEVESAAGPIYASLVGFIEDFGGSPRGELFLAADELPFDVVKSLADLESADAWPSGRAEQARLDLRLEQPGGRWTATLLAAELAVEGEGVSISTRDPRIDASLEPVADGARLRLELRPSLGFTDRFRAVGEWRPEDLTTISWEAAIEGVNLGALLDATRVPPSNRFAAEALRGGEVEGTLDLTVRGEIDAVEFEAEAWIRRLATGLGLDFRSATVAELDASGVLSFANGADRLGAVEVGLKVPEADVRLGQWVLPRYLFPAETDLSCIVEGAVCRDGDFDLRPSTMGGVRIAGDLAFDEADPAADLRWSWEGASLASLRELIRDLGGTWPDQVAAEGRIEASGSIAGDPTDPTITGSAGLKGLAMTIPLGESAGEVAAVRLETGSVEFGVGQRLEVAAPSPGLDLDLLLPGQAAGVLLQLSGRVISDRALTAVGVETLSATSPSLGSVALAGEWSRASEAGFEGRLELSDLAVPMWQELLDPYLPIATEGYQVAGRVSASFDLGLELAGLRWRADGRSDLQAAGFSSEDGSRVLEGFDTRSDWSLRGTGVEAVSGEMTSSIGGFVLLLGTFFADASYLESEFGSVFELRSSASGEDAWRAESKWAVKEGPRIELDLNHPGTSPPGTTEVRFVAAVNDLASTKERYLEPILGELMPALEVRGSVLASGTAEWRASDDWSSDARLQISGLDLRLAGGGLVVESLDLDLPSRLTSTASEPGHYSGERMIGTLDFGRLDLGGIELPPAELSLITEGDSVWMGDSLEFELLGGRVGLPSLRLRELLRATRRLESGLTLESIDLEMISHAMELPHSRESSTRSFHASC